MRKLSSCLLLFMFALLLATRSPAPLASASSTPADESARAPFSLEMPEAGSVPITATEARIPTHKVPMLRFNLRKQYADSIDYGDIYTTINGESANTVCQKGRGKDGYIIRCDLESKPHLRLRPGKNVVEISATSRDKHAYYASYVLLAGDAAAREDSSADGATLETVAVALGDDRQPPEIRMTLPNSLVRLTKPADRLRVAGSVRDEANAIEFVKLNGQRVAVTPIAVGRVPQPKAANPSGAAQTSAAQTSNAVAFESVVNVRANTFIVIEAQDRAGNLTRLTIPVREREAAVSSKFSGRKFAVVIGVSRYRFHDGGLRDLEYADADARAIRDFLQSPEGGGFAANDVLYLENEQATTDGVRAALTRFLPKAGPNDLVFLFIAGHGAPDPYGPQKLYFILHDTKVADMPRTALPMSELQNFLDHSVRAERVVVFVDACHSAGLSGAKLITTRGLEHTENNVFNLYASKLFREQGRAVLTSSDVNEISQESNLWGGGHGVFTWALLEGLRGSADTNTDKIVTAGELFDFVSNRVRLETSFQQNPTALAGLNKDFALAVAPK